MRHMNQFGALLVVLSLALVACGDGEGEVDGGIPPILEPEPVGAPTLLAEGRLTCLGRNTPTAPGRTTLTLPGWVRKFADPDNETKSQPPAQVEAFDETGLSIGSSFSDTGTGRVALTVPIRQAGFSGSVKVSADGYVEQRLFFSRPTTKTDATTDPTGWAWMLTPTELADLAEEAGVTLDPAKGTVVGAVHDCLSVYGVANAVVRYGNRTDGVAYFEGKRFFKDFAVAPMRTFTSPMGRFAIANATPGPLTIEAFGRLVANGPLTLLSRADVVVEAGVISAVDLEPRVGTDR